MNTFFFHILCKFHFTKIYIIFHHAKYFNDRIYLLMECNAG